MPSASSRSRTAGVENRETASTRCGLRAPAMRRMNASRQRRPHLARGADDQDVAVQPADAVEVGVGWLGEEVLERALVADLRWKRQNRTRTPSRTTRPTEKPSVLPTVSASSTAVLPFAATPLIR